MNTLSARLGRAANLLSQRSTLSSRPVNVQT
jgi:hypothetical protein